MELKTQRRRTPTSALAAHFLTELDVLWQLLVDASEGEQKQQRIDNWEEARNRYVPELERIARSGR